LDYPSYLRRALGLFFKLNTRKLDHHDFYISGWRNQLKIEGLFPFTSDFKPKYYIYNDIRYYHRIGQKGNFATRLGIGISNETVGPFSPFITDSYQNIRGIGYRAQFGNSIGIVNLEYRQTVIENRIGGVQMVIFTDMGNLKPGNISHKNWNYAESLQIFTGLGMRLIYKKVYNAILSIDVGVNMHDTSQMGWVIGMGQYF
jgi:outer membrane translocation and assembly module TamA